MRIGSALLCAALASGTAAADSIAVSSP